MGLVKLTQFMNKSGHAFVFWLLLSYAIFFLILGETRLSFSISTWTWIIRFIACWCLRLLYSASANRMLTDFSPFFRPGWSSPSLPRVPGPVCRGHTSWSYLQPQGRLGSWCKLKNWEKTAANWRERVKLTLFTKPMLTNHPPEKKPLTLSHISAKDKKWASRGDPLINYQLIVVYPVKLCQWANGGVCYTYSHLHWCHTQLLFKWCRHAGWHVHIT